MNFTEQAFRFDCTGEQLLGIIANPEQPESTGVLIVVGGPQYRVGSHRQFVLLARALAERGYSVVRFDYRGMGDSSGEQRDFQAVDADIHAVVRFTAQALPRANGCVLLGLCDAAAAILMYALHDAHLRGLVVLNPWVRSAQLEARARVKHYYGQRFLQASFWRKLLSGELAVVSAVREAFATWWAARRDNGSVSAAPADFRTRMLGGLERYTAPMLLLLSGQDLTAREFEDWCENTPAWRTAFARAGVERVDMPGADHTFSMRADLDQVNAVIAAWLDRLD